MVEEAARVEVLLAETLRVRGREGRHLELENGDRLEMAVLEFRFAVALLKSAAGEGSGRRRAYQTQEGNLRSVSSVISTHPR